MEKTKKTSAGIIITDGVNVILGHVTGQKNWDLPKGGVDEGETLIHAAVRELKEETGLTVAPHQLTGLGLYPYTTKKNLQLYVWQVTEMPNTKHMVCTSLFDTGKGKLLPELDAFVSVAWKDLHKYVRPSMMTVLRTVEPKIRELFKNESK